MLCARTGHGAYGIAPSFTMWIATMTAPHTKLEGNTLSIHLESWYGNSIMYENVRAVDAIDDDVLTHGEAARTGAEIFTAGAPDVRKSGE